MIGKPAFAIRVGIALVTAIPVVSRARATEPLNFARDIEPILQMQCMECHGPQQQESGLRLDQRSSMLRGGDHGESTIVPGKPEKSFLLQVVRGTNPHLRMPPDGDLLNPNQITLLSRWIEEGANWPGQMDATVDDVHSDHWSLKPITANTTDEASPPQQIDTFIIRRLGESGLTLSPPADPTTLIRRLTLVLTGLAPTPAEVNDFMNDPDGIEAAYQKAVDRLLDSPRYGERWAQHWLDVIRWAETVGFETNIERPRAWPYRDWVIQSLNEDKPYDRFVYEQLVGDTLGADAALGFLVAGPANLPGQIGRDEEAMRQSRQDELDEVIRTVSQALLGLTVGCARCHNHKFDPILQRDYYAMQAVFAGLSYGNRRWRGELNHQYSAKVPAAKLRLEQLEHELESLRTKHGLKPPLDLVHTEHFEAIRARSIRMEIMATDSGGPASLYEFSVLTPASDRSLSRNIALSSTGATPSASSFALANQTRHFDNLVDGSVDRRQAFPWVAKSAGPAWVQIDFAQPETIHQVIWDRGSTVPAEYVISVLVDETGAWQPIADTSDRFPRESDTRKAERIDLKEIAREDVAAIVAKNGEVRTARAELRRLSDGPQVFAARFSDSPDPTWLLHRGDPMQRRQQLAPAIPMVLGDLELAMDEPESKRRLAFAKHLTRPDHPLTTRVIVNRIWQHHFGQGLVDTPSDFGKMGSLPTHPDLLDFLVKEFVKGGWSLKHLHRQIVMSRTFRQTSRPRADALQVDSETRFLWRFPPRRLEAEAIRDSILFASGKLSLKMGGPGFSFFKQRGGLSDYKPIETFDESGWRRMIYAHKIRMQEVDVFGTFDCPDAGQMKPRRTQSITPSQSLGLFNSPFVMRQASFFADRVRAEAGDRPTDQIAHAFEIALSRAPSEDEYDQMLELVRQEGLIQLCRVLMNTSEFLYIQ